MPHTPLRNAAYTSNASTTCLAVMAMLGIAVTPKPVVLAFEVCAVRRLAREAAAWQHAVHVRLVKHSCVC